MSELDQLPEHHRAYVLARVNVLSAAQRSTAALDALVTRGVTDAEELPLRDRRYLAARGGMASRGEDPAVLDEYAAEYVAGPGPNLSGRGPDLHRVDHEDLRRRGPDRADGHRNLDDGVEHDPPPADDLVVGGVTYRATEWETDGAGGVRRIGSGGAPDWPGEGEAAPTGEGTAEKKPAPAQNKRTATGPGPAPGRGADTPARARARAAPQNQVPRAVRLAGLFGGPMYGPPAPSGAATPDPAHRAPARGDAAAGGAAATGGGAAGHRRAHPPTREQEQEYGR